MTTDRMTKEQRSALMGKIRSRDTGPELALKYILERAGIDFEYHPEDFPGNPDFSLVRMSYADGRIFVEGIRALIFVDGDFWHGRDYEKQRGRLSPYWDKKIKANMERDAAVNAELSADFAVIRVWEGDLGDDPDGVGAFLLALPDYPPKGLIRFKNDNKEG